MRQLLKGRNISQPIMEVYESENLLSIAPTIRELFPDSIREVRTLSIFKNKIKARTTDKYSCRLCKNYIGQVTFTN